MGISDRNLRAISYFSVFCGYVGFFLEKPVAVLGAWAVAVMIVLYRSLFNHTEKYREDGSQFFLEIFDGVLTTVAIVMVVSGFIGFGMSGPFWASMLWAIGFVAFQARITFTQTRHMGRR